MRLGGVPEHFNYPWHLAMGSTGLADLSLTWTDQPGGTGAMVEELAAGRLDLVSILTEGTVRAIDDGLDVVILQVYVASPLRWGVFVPAASPFDDQDELAEARIAISRFGSGSHLMAYVHAEANGFTMDPDRFVEVGGLDGAVEAFTDGRAELFLWDQYMTRPLVDSGAFRQLGVQETPWPSFVIAARREVLLARTAEVGRIVDAVVACAVGLQGRAGVVDELSTTYGLTVETVEGWLATTEYGPRAPFDRSIADQVRQVLGAAGLA